MVVWTQNALLDNLRRYRANQSQAQLSGTLDPSRVTSTLPKRNYAPPDNETIQRRRQDSFMEQIGNIRDTYDYEPGNQPSDALERAEDLMFRTGRVNDRIQKRLSRPKIKSIPFSYNVNVPMPYAQPLPNPRPGTEPFVAVGKNKKGQKVDQYGLPKNLMDPRIPVAKSLAQKPGNFKLFKQAISGKESGGNYGAVNPDSGAAGKYQIMPGNFAGPGGWDKEALGYDITLQQFMNNPKLQEAMATYKLRQYYNQFGPAGAAAAWYAGPDNANSWKSDTGGQGAYPSIHNYVLSILKAMGLR